MIAYDRTVRKHEPCFLLYLDTGVSSTWLNAGAHARNRAQARNTDQAMRDIFNCPADAEAMLSRVAGYASACAIATALDALFPVLAVSGIDPKRAHPLRLRLEQ